eukprot:COSAG06_NODE_828_length_12054_cov_67.028440_15_plen_109_part_01
MLERSEGQPRDVDIPGAKTVVLSHLYIKTIFLPRQARDKHKNSSKNTIVFSGLFKFEAETGKFTLTLHDKGVPYGEVESRKMLATTEFTIPKEQVSATSMSTFHEMETV